MKSHPPKCTLCGYYPSPFFLIFIVYTFCWRAIKIYVFFIDFFLNIENMNLRWYFKIRLIRGYNNPLLCYNFMYTYFYLLIYLYFYIFMNQQIVEVEIIWHNFNWLQIVKSILKKKHLLSKMYIKIFQIIYYPIIFYDLCPNSIFDNKFWHFIYIPKHLFALFLYVKYI